MLGTTQNLPGDIAELRAILAVRDEEIAAGKAEIRVRDLLIEKLKHQLAGCVGTDLGQAPRLWISWR